MEVFLYKFSLIFTLEYCHSLSIFQDNEGIREDDEGDDDDSLAEAAYQLKSFWSDLENGTLRLLREQTI